MMAPLALFAALAALTQPSSPRQHATLETVVEIRVHGNHTTPDADVLRLAGVTPGSPFAPALVAAVENRLRQSGRFRTVEVRKRYRSIEDARAIVLVILVEEQAGVSADVPAPGPLRRLKASTMWLPVLAFEDGYGFTYGARVGVVDALGRRTRLSVPLTWGGERRASVDLERRFLRGPFTRVVAEGGIIQREHPSLDVDDRRTGAGLRVERAIGPWVRVGARGRLTDVRFGDDTDRLGTAGIEATLDTRRDPASPRNALYASAAVDRLWFERARDTSRVTIDTRAYGGLVRQVVLVVRALEVWSPHALPVFEQALLGGAASLRGFRLGFRMGDRLTAGSAELRMPFTSPLRVARTGVAVFTDTGTAYAAGGRLSDARWDTSAGAGVFVTAPIIAVRLDVAHGVDAGTRVHFGLGLSF
jgi:outer membrane protein assembly factor BamA